MKLTMNDCYASVPKLNDYDAVNTLSNAQFILSVKKNGILEHGAREARSEKE